MRIFNLIDQMIIHFDHSLRTVVGQPIGTQRKNPMHGVEKIELTASEKKLSERLMRVNHAGEVSAQALYQGQALMARTDQVKENMKQSAIEENDHLIWCESRLQELNGHVSYFNPFWYAGSYMIGSVAGLAGDRWSLGFIVETEKQVIKHLESHLKQMSPNDLRSRVILEQMKIDETHHAAIASEHGSYNLPKPIQGLMAFTSKVMTKTAYWL